MSVSLRKLLKITAFTVFAVAAVLLVAALSLYIYARKNVNYDFDDALFARAGGEGVIRLYAVTEGDGVETEQLLEEVYFGGYKKTHVPIERVPDSIKAAFLAAEDRSFYEHHGVNVARTLLAALNTVTHRAPTFGASTITQQVVKNISGDSEVTFKRKLTEMLRAVHMEHVHTKDEILELYLNVVPMSEQMLGIGKAAEVYFGVPVEELSFAQAATLAGIANAPSRYNPHTHPTEALEKRNRVLYAMHDAGYITDREYEEAKAEPLGVLDRTSDTTPVLSWFAETVLKEIEADLVREQGMSREAAHRYVVCGGFSVITTVNPKAQAVLEEYFGDESRFSVSEDAPTYAMCVCDSMTGELVAVVGRQGEKRASLLSNAACDTPHTPGSTLKPLALYAPLINEKRIHAATVFDDVPLSFEKNKDSSYTAFPRNSPAVYQGLTTVADALRLSKNTVAVRLYGMRGAENIYRSLQRDFSFDTVTRSAYGTDGSKRTDLAPSPLALGQLTYGVTLRKLTEAYTVFPSEGVTHTSRSYKEVRDGQGKVLLLKKDAKKRVYSVECARIMNTLLSGVTESGTAKSIQLKNTVDTAGKTGTSGDDLDRLFIGYTPYYTAGIWCGYESGNRPIGRVCVSHLTAWDEVMTKIHAVCVHDSEESYRTFSTEGLVRLPFCKDSGEGFTLTCAADPRRNRMSYAYFTPDNAPTGVCTRHVEVAYDSLTKAIAHDGCPAEDVTRVSLIRVEDRHFPTEVYVSDAEYVYHTLDTQTPLGDTFDRPYFMYAQRDGDFCGISIGRKQFNAGCYLHDSPQGKVLYESEDEDEISSA